MSARLVLALILSLTSSVFAAPQSSLFPPALPVAPQPQPKAPRPTRVPPDAFHAPTIAETKARLAAALAWQNDAFVRSYDRVGRRDARWDADVKAAFALVARSAALDPTRPGDLYDQAWYLLTKAVKAGCNDPLVRYELAAMNRTSLTRSQAASQMRSAALALDSSGYPVYLRGIALIRASDSLVSSGSGLASADYEPILLQTGALIDRARADLAEIVKDRSIPDALVLGYVEELCNAYVAATHRDRKLMFDPAFDAVKAARDANDPVLPVLTAAFFIKYAWDARGTEYAHEVAESAWSDFSARLGEAENAIRVAAGLGTGSPAIPRLMMTIVGGSNGDLDEIIPWFRLGVLANPGDRGLYEAMLNWASPKWHGSFEDAEALARDSVATKNWNVRLPLMVVDVHDELSRLTSDWKAYFKMPFVCGEIAPVYDEFLKRYPDAGYDRGGYALRLTYCGRWADAKRQIDLIAPDRLRVGAFGGQAAYERTVADIAAHLK